MKGWWGQAEILIWSSVPQYERLFSSDECANKPIRFSFGGNQPIRLFVPLSYYMLGSCLAEGWLMDWRLDVCILPRTSQFSYPLWVDQSDSYATSGLPLYLCTSLWHRPISLRKSIILSCVIWPMPWPLLTFPWRVISGHKINILY